MGMGFGSVVGNGCGCHERALWPHREPVTFFASNRQRRPGDSPVPAVLRTRDSAQRLRRASLARRASMVRVYDRALLASGRIHGDPVERMLDRFAIGTTGARMGSIRATAHMTLRLIELARSTRGEVFVRLFPEIELQREMPVVHAVRILTCNRDFCICGSLGLSIRWYFRRMDRQRSDDWRD